MTTQPIDSLNNPLPVLRLKKNGAHTIAAGAITARNSSAFDSKTEVISLYSSVPVYVAFGGSDIEATSSDHYFPAEIYYDLAIGADSGVHYTHMAVLRADSSDGTVYISEKE
tara:strand:+ start:261 stop:596 length:336 start_codon:yes stop_codon:yes gene_type:complete